MPITDLQLSLSGGQDAAYRTDCSSTSGTIDGALAAQDGATHSVDAPLHIDPCSPPATPAPPTTARAPRTPKGALTGARFAGLRAGRPSLSFKVAAAKGAPKLRRLTIQLWPALAFKRTHGRIRGAAVKGGSIATRQLAGGKFVLTLAAPRAAVTVEIGSRALRESHGLATRLAHRHARTPLRSLLLVTNARDAAGHVFTFRRHVRKLGL
jgi:hypothetical protein